MLCIKVTACFFRQFFFLCAFILQGKDVFNA